MRSNTPSSPARRDRRLAARRARRRPVLMIGGLALAALTTAGITGAAPATQAVASSPISFSLASAVTPLSASAAPDAQQNAAQPEAAESATALSAAQAALAAATSVTADIQTAGLDIGDPNPTVDTAALEAAVTRLEALDGPLEAFAPSAADTVAELTAPVTERAAQLRAGLDAAAQRKAEEEAAEKARIEAEAAAAAAAKAAETTRAAAKPAASAPAATGGNVVPQGDAQAIAAGMLGNYGWGSEQMGCLVPLWQKESGWNVSASNRSSGAYGIPQALPGSKMASAGADWQTNPATQIAWGLGYISGRYGSPCGAWSHSQSVGWY